MTDAKREVITAHRGNFAALVMDFLDRVVPLPAALRRTRKRATAPSAPSAPAGTGPP